MPQDKEQATEDELDVPGDLEQALLVSGSGQLCSRGGSKFRGEFYVIVIPYSKFLSSGS